MLPLILLMACAPKAVPVDPGVVEAMPAAAPSPPSPDPSGAAALHEDGQQGSEGTGAPTPAPASAFDEVQIGRRYHQIAAGKEGLVEDEDAQLAVHALTMRLVAASERPERVVHVQLLDSSEINAFALPGGYVSVYRGIWEDYSDEELAFVLAHELAHVNLRHGVSGQADAEAAVAVFDAMTAALDDDDAEAISSFMEQQQYYSLMSMKRSHELEADAYGLLTMLRAGYAGDAAIAAMEKSVQRDGARATRLWDSHPASADRLAELQAGLEEIRDVAVRFDIGVSDLEAGQPQAACERFEEVVATFPKSKAARTNLGVCNLQQIVASSDQPYLDAVRPVVGFDVVLKGEGRGVIAARAQQAFELAAQLGGEDAVIAAGLGVLARHTGDPATAVEKLLLAEQLAEGAAWTRLNLAAAQAASGDLDAAIPVLHELTADEAWAATATANLAFAAEAQGDKGDAKALWLQLVGGHHTDLARAHLAALDAPVAAPAPAEDASDSRRQIGPVTMGMWFDDLPKELLLRGSSPVDEQVFVNPVPGVELIFEHGTLRRVGVVGSTDWPLDSGVRVGTPRAEVLALQGQPQWIFQGPDGRTHFGYEDRQIELVMGKASDLVSEIDVRLGP